MSKPPKRRGAWQYVYDGTRLLAVIEQHSDDGHWHVIVAGRDVGACGTREAALRLVDAIKQEGVAE